MDLRRGGQRLPDEHARRAHDGDVPGADVQPRRGAGERVLLGHRRRGDARNFFRRATENPEALAAYAKFLRHATLVEAAPTGFSSEAFRSKMQRIQKELPGWVQKSGKQAQAMPLVQKLEAFLKDRKWLEVDKVADELLSLMEGEKPGEVKP